MSDLADEDAANYVYDDASPEESDEVENPVDSEEGESKGEDGGFSWNGFDHVRQMQEQNRTLIVMLEQEKAKVKKLKSELSIYQVVGKDDSPDIREKRLIELAKKNRNLNLALEREKLSNAKLQAELRKTKENIPAITATEQTSSPTSPKADAVKDQVEDIEFKYKETKEKLNQATNKLMDLRVQNESLKAELGRTQRALQKEVGDDVPLSKILEDSSGWKGRAQQISILKAKVSELKQSLGIPLGSSVAPSTYAPSVYQPSETASIRPSSAKTAATFDDRHREVIETKVKNARLEADKLTSDLVSKTEEANQYKMKYDASQARIKTLENEIRSLKNKIQVFYSCCPFCPHLGHCRNSLKRDHISSTEDVQ
eukprot:TRINITY_DN5151_c0_g1_i7.p1 TRINITY_DN5151_c0_g1~~TRINITY_DN5151_c0_g1_i7.p1  ORF type:complete len:371 (-),score=82.44 TRINITY_DN5151_c0_g1_i7:68-1180(-)